MLSTPILYCLLREVHADKVQRDRDIGKEREKLNFNLLLFVFNWQTMGYG